jgi:hypothetical protein
LADRLTRLSAPQGKDPWLVRVWRAVTELQDKEELEVEWIITDPKTSTYSASFGELVQCNPAGGAFVVVLPRAADLKGGELTVANISSSTTAITVTAAGSDTILGASTYSITAAYGALVLVSDGVSKWVAI